MGDDNVTPIDRRTKLVRQVREQMQEESGEEDRYEKQGRAQCKVCSVGERYELPNAATLREQVDVWYARGFSVAEIDRRVQELVADWPEYEGDNPRYDPRPSRDSLENHTKRHTSDSARIGRELAVLRARQLGEVEEIMREQFIEPLVDASFIAASLARDALTSGRIRPTHLPLSLDTPFFDLVTYQPTVSRPPFRPIREVC